VGDQVFYAKMLECSKKPDALAEYNDFSGFPNALNVTIYDSNKDCYWHPAQLALGGKCADSRCNFNYFMPTDFRLAVFLPSTGRLYLSNELTRTEFDSYFQVELNKDGSAGISETRPGSILKNIIYFLPALAITVVLELLAAFAYLAFSKLDKRILVSVFLANIVSLPIVWFVFPLISPELIIIIIPAELFAFLFESAVIYALNHDKLGLKQALLLSLIANAISFVIGGVIYLGAYLVLSFII
ncbi:hypothetical protein COX84_06120, partial [Candidatus Micrarchaeota archaeon CG_4_10_14_0_2_um_filter_49_7]